MVKKNEKLIEETEVTVQAPFTYYIGEEGPITGNLLETVQDCIDEAKAELEQGIMDAMVVVDRVDRN